MSKVSAFYHIVFCTKGRRMTLPLEQCEHLYRFIWKELISKKCRLLRIGGIQNHVHMLIDLHPSVALSALIRDIKTHASGWLRTDSRFPVFDGWAAEYYAASVSAKDTDSIILYIKNQWQHHLTAPFDNEIATFCSEAHLEYDDRDLR